MNKDIENIYVDLKVRTSKVENKIFQIILDKIKENIENLDNIYNLGLKNLKRLVNLSKILR